MIFAHHDIHRALDSGNSESEKLSGIPKEPEKPEEPKKTPENLKNLRNYSLCYSPYSDRCSEHRQKVLGFPGFPGSLGFTSKGLFPDIEWADDHGCSPAG